MSFFVIIFLTIIIDLEKILNIFLYLYIWTFPSLSEKKNVLNDFYSETKSEILGYEDYLKLDTTEQYKNNQDRLKRVEKGKWNGAFIKI